MDVAKFEEWLSGIASVAPCECRHVVRWGQASGIPLEERQRLRTAEIDS